MRLHGVLRERGDGRDAQVTNTELFFDLVYVFAITQLSEYLYSHHLTTGGALRALVLFLAVWWAWNYTAWATGWIDPGRTKVVVLMAALMVLSLVMAASIPEAFGRRGGTFALTYVGIQGLRSAFMVAAFPPEDRMRRNYAQLLAWSLIAGALWVIGAFAFSGDERLIVWAVAAIVDLAAPMHGFWLPGIAPTDMSDWTVAGEHLAERCHLVLIIAFGESVLRVGESFGEVHDGTSVVLAFLAGFALTFGLWAIYFLSFAQRGLEKISDAEDEAGRMGRSGYAYAHMLMVAGVIVVAVAVRTAIAAPQAGLHTATAVTFATGPVIYLLGLVMFKRAIAEGEIRPPLIACVLIVCAAAAIGAARGEELVGILAATAIGVGLSIQATWAQRALLHRS